MDAAVQLIHNNPRVKANILSKYLFVWIIPFYRKILNKGLEIADLFKISESDNSEKLGDELENNWYNELRKAQLKRQDPKLLNAIKKTFFWKYMIYGGILFVHHVGLRSLQPVVLSYLISLFDRKDDNQKEMYLSTGILIIISLLVVSAHHHCNFGQAFIGMRMRIGLSSLIYRKILKLNKKSLNETTVGQVINLLSNDVTRFDFAILFLHYLWMLPFQVAIITYLLWLQVGISSLVGVISIALLSFPVQGYLGKLSSKFRLRVAKKTDRRITWMNEIILGMQIIKMYAWEQPLKTVIESVRLEEVKALTISSYARAMFLTFMIFIERTALFLTLVCCVFVGNGILPEQVFAMSLFFNVLQMTMSVFYPMALSYGAEGLVSIERIQNFLMMEENQKPIIQVDCEKEILLKSVNTSWQLDQKFLTDITFHVPPGSLCAIVGPVGAGKSSILHLLLNELTPQSGTIKLQGTISYSSQEPWLFSSTVRNNIIFGQKYDKKRYNKIVKVCALQKDFSQLQFGDNTLVGERGAALSGGQQARVNLARAVYRDADIYLLDDPLSAVDTNVSKHLFEECIVKYLKNKTRILVTHQLQYLKEVDHIVVIIGGKLSAQGSYQELSQHLNFCREVVDNNEHNDIKITQKSSLLLSDSFNRECEDLSNSVFEKIEEEVGTVDTMSPLREYVSASGSCCRIFLAIFTLILCQILCSGTDYWVTFWTQQEALKMENIMLNKTVTNQNFKYSQVIHTKVNYTVQLNETVPGISVDTYTALYIYSSLIVVLITIAITRSLFYFKMTMCASKNLHTKVFDAILEAPMRFFNTNPSGRILNRFSKDLGAVDDILPRALLEAIQLTLICCGILVMVVISNYYMVVGVIVTTFLYIKIRSWFVATSKEIKHLEGIAKSPVFSHTNSSLNGITTIRAFGAEDTLQKEFDNLQDIHTSACYLNITCMFSFGFWLDVLSVVFLSCTSFSFIILNYFGQVSGSLVGLAITQSLSLAGFLQYGTRQSAEVVNQLTSVERILQYTEIEKEGPFATAPENLPPSPWPSNGLIVIRDLYLQYAPNDPPVLKYLNAKIKPAEKIGIVGRTGAGKSSLIAALFRLTPFEGDIIIDGINTKFLGLHDLRRSLSIIPQEPVLFSTTVRYNLDPLYEFGDNKLWQVIEDVELKEIISGLDMMVTGGGKNFSTGQRQLLCLARAILQNSKVLILDEVTANIDEKTDALIQQTVKRKFKNCTVLTVAHRLKTIMDSDRVMVMENGEIVEFDYPYVLLQRPESLFNKMVLATGPAMSIQLEEIALDRFLNNRLQE